MDNQSSQSSIYPEFPLKLLHLGLTDRELDILACIQSGRGVKKAANFLMISPKTVESHIRNIMLKFQTSSRENLIDQLEKTESLLFFNHRYNKIINKGKSEVKDDKNLFIASGFPAAETFIPFVKKRKLEKFYVLDNFFIFLKRIRKKIKPVYIYSGSLILFIFCVAIYAFLDLRLITKVFTYPQSFHSNLLPYYNNAYLTRQQFIDQMKQKLSDKRPIKTIVLQGIGGAGKTDLACQYALASRSNLIWLLNAETVHSLMRSYECLACELSHPKIDEETLKSIQQEKKIYLKYEKIINFVKEKLKAQSGWVLIVDNVEQYSDIQQYLPNDSRMWGEGKIIITTRNELLQSNHIFDEKDVISIKELTAVEQLDLFKRILSPTLPFSENHISLIKKFLKTIPPFPLDTSLAAYYIKLNQIPYENYSVRIVKYNEGFDKLQKTILKDVNGYANTRHTIISLTLEKLLKKDHRFKDLLVIISLINSHSIPKDFLEKFADKDIVDTFFHDLKEHSLIKETFFIDFSQNCSFSLHPSLQPHLLSYLVDRLGSEQIQNIVQNLSRVMQDYSEEALEQDDLKTLTLLIQHLQNLNNCPAINTPALKAAFRGQLAQLYSFFHLNLTQAKSFFEQNIEFYESQGEESRPFLAWNLGNLGILYNNLVKDKKAQSFFEQSLQVYQAHFNCKIPFQALWVISELGRIYCYKGEFEEARNILEKALVVCKNIYNSSSTKMIRAKLYLANVYQELGRYQEAKSALEQIINSYQSALKKNDLRIVETLSYLGWIEGRMGWYKKSCNYFQKAYELYKNTFGPDHKKTSWAAVYLSNAYKNLGYFKEAAELIEQSYNINYQAEGENSLDRAWALIYRGDLYLSKKDFWKARVDLEESLKIYQEIYGKDHIDVAWISYLLSQVYLGSEELGQAKICLEKSLKIYESHYPQDHIELARIIKTFGDFFIKMECPIIAEIYLRKAFEIFKDNHHSDQYKCLLSLSELYKIQEILNSTKEKNFLWKQKNSLEQALELTYQCFDSNSFFIEEICYKKFLLPLQQSRISLLNFNRLIEFNTVFY